MWNGPIVAQLQAPGWELVEGRPEPAATSARSWSTKTKASSSASGPAATRVAFFRQTGSAQEPFAGTLAADASVVQCFDGMECSATIWCAEEREHMKLREFKHTFTDRNRVITLLLLESAEPRDWDDSWKDEQTPDASDQSRNSGQSLVR